MIYIIYLPAYIILFYLYFILKKNINKNIIEIGFLTGLVYFIFIPLSTYLINNGYESYDTLANKSWSDHSKTITQLSINIYLSLFIILNMSMIYIYHFFNKKSIKRLKNSYLVKKNKLFLIIGITILPILFLELMIPASIVHWYEKAKYLNSNFGMFAVVIKYLYTSMRFVTLIILINNFKISKKYLYLYLLLLLAVIDMFVTGNRIFLVIVVFSTIIQLIIFKKTKTLIVLSFISIPIGMFMIAWAQIRSLLGNMSLSESMETSYKVFEKINFADIVFQLTEGADFLILLSIIRDFGDKFNYLVGESFLKLFVFPIPRSIYEDKPDSIGRTMGILYQPETDGLALNTTLLGEEFANFGLFGFLILGLLLISFHFLRKFSNKNISYYMLPFYFTFPFLMMRTNVSDVFIQTIVTFFILLILTKKVQR